MITSLVIKKTIMYKEFFKEQCSTGVVGFIKVASVFTLLVVICGLVEAL